MTYHCCGLSFHNWEGYREHFESRRLHYNAEYYRQRRTMNRKIIVLGLVVGLLMGLSFLLTETARGQQPPAPGGPPCGHGNSNQPCRPDPQPTTGKDCQPHGRGGINEDHCPPGVPTQPPIPTQPPAPTQPPLSTQPPASTPTSVLPPASTPTAPTGSTATPIPTPFVPLLPPPPTPYVVSECARDLAGFHTGWLITREFPSLVIISAVFNPLLCPLGVLVPPPPSVIVLPPALPPLVLPPLTFPAAIPALAPAQPAAPAPVATAPAIRPAQLAPPRSGDAGLKDQAGTVFFWELK